MVASCAQIHNMIITFICRPTNASALSFCFFSIFSLCCLQAFSIFNNPFEKKAQSNSIQRNIRQDMTDVVHRQSLSLSSFFQLTCKCNFLSFLLSYCESNKVISFTDTYFISRIQIHSFIRHPLKNDF